MSPSVASAKNLSCAQSNRRILLVEDELFIRWMLSEELREAGYDVIEACDAAEAFLILQAVRPDLIISDVRMPGELDGMDLLKHVRKTMPTLPVIIMSGHLDPQQALEAGAIKYVAKPYILGVVLEAAAEGLTTTP